MVAVFTRKGSFCALVDIDNAFDRIRAEAAGMVLHKVLWVCGKRKREGGQIRSFNSIRNPTASGNRNNYRNNIEEKRWKQIQQHSSANSKHPGPQSQQFNSLERAFKAADILMHHGGFGLIAVDLSCIDEARLRKIPLTTWFRFVRVADETQTALIFLTSSPLAYSCVGLKLHVNGSLSSSLNKEMKYFESRYAPESLGASEDNSTGKNIRNVV